VVFLLGLGAALGAYATGGLDYLARHHHVFGSWNERAVGPDVAMRPYGGEEDPAYGPPPGVGQPMDAPRFGGHDMVLRVSGTALNGFCTERYAIDNRSNRRVIVVFSPSERIPSGAGEGFDPRHASYGYDAGYEGPVDEDYSNGAYGPYTAEQFHPDEGDDPRRDADPRDRENISPDAAPDQGGPYPDAMPRRAMREQAPPPVAVAPGEVKVIGRENDRRAADMDGGGPDDGMPPDQRCGDRVVKLQLTDCAREDGACVARN